MRHWNDWMQKLKPDLEYLDMETNELEMFLTIEYCLTVHYDLCPQRPANDAWALLSGYFESDIHSNHYARKVSSIARPRARFIRTQESFKFWLAWYQSLNPEWRIYDFDIDGLCIPIQSSLAPNRHEIYKLAITKSSPFSERNIQWATSGEYTFDIRDSKGRIEKRSVRIPKEFEEIAEEDVARIPEFTLKRDRLSSIQITLKELRASAEWLQQEDPDGDWINRYENRILNLRQVTAEGEYIETDSLTIDKLFHLVGMVNAGKSTLIDLIIVALSLRPKPLHITLMVNTVVEAIEKASYFRMLGFKSAPALGRDRVSHRQKYGQAKTTILQPNVVFGERVIHDKSVSWLTGACAISARMDNGNTIPTGQEPCRGLMDSKERQYSCPLLLRCSTHRATQDMLDSTIWIVTPASFLFSRAPMGFSSSDLHLLEAVYFHSDLLIIDEADRVQLQWDNQFAPINNLFGRTDSLINELDVALNQSNRPDILSNTQVLRFRNKARQVVSLTESTYALLLREKDIRDWCGNVPLTPTALFFQLAGDIAEQSFDKDENADNYQHLRETLYDDFKTYIRFPDSKEGSPFSDWVNDFRQYNSTSNLHDSMSDWLISAKQLQWWHELDKATQYRLLRRFEFALLLKAMDKYLDEVLREIDWVAPVLGVNIQSYFRIPEEHTHVIPDSPIGNLLGYHFLEQDNVLRFMRCQGIGRWLLTNFHQLYYNIDDINGAHVLLTSATSWAKGSSFFHLIAPPNAVLELSQSDRTVITENSQYQFDNLHGDLINISGSSLEYREKNLRVLVNRLTNTIGRLPSPLIKELKYWESKGVKRRILIVVGSYKDAQFVTNILNEHPDWQGRVRQMISDDPQASTIINPSRTIARGKIQHLRDFDTADVLVAPLLAIQRGFNILDSAGGALLGSAFFLVRPLPVPDDFSQHLIGANAWAMRELYANNSFLPSPTSSNELPIRAFRNQAYRNQWIQRLEDSQSGMIGLPDDLLYELLWNQMIVVWQTIGRLVRRGRPARVIFVDGAFMKQPPMLLGWEHILAEYLETSADLNDMDKTMAETLYRPFYEPLKKMIADYTESRH